MMTRLLRRARHWLRQGHHQAELADEMEFHRAARQQALEAGGLSPAEAAAASRRTMGNVTLAAEDARGVWLWPALERIWHDARYGARALRREPTFAITATLTLALGVAATTTVFSIVDAELWKPLPFPESERLVVLFTTPPGGAITSYEHVSAPDLAEWRRQTRAFEDIAGFVWASRHVLRRGGVTESLTTMAVTPTFFPTMRIQARQGRAIGPEDEHNARAVLLTDACWRRSFAADPAIVGHTLMLDGDEYAVVGVTGPDMHLEFYPDPDLFTVAGADAAGARDRTARSFDAVGRLRPGVDLAQARAEMQTITARLALTYPAADAGRGIWIGGLRENFTGYRWRPLYFFLGASLFVLVLSCANVANLLLARALRRQREFAIRGALGGGRGALVRQLLVEGALVAVPGAGAGVLLATWALRILSTRLPPGYVDRGGHFAVDVRVCVFALLVCGLTAILFGLAPAWFARRIDLNVILGQGRSLGGSPGQRRLRHGLVIAEVVLTLVLLAGAGLFVRSFLGVMRMPLGFEPHGRVTMRIPLSGPRYAAPEQMARFAGELLDRLRAVPGVRDAAVGSDIPLQSGPSTRFVVSDRPRVPEADEPFAIVRAVSPDYFRTLAIRSIAGRAFTERDVDGAPLIAIINAQLARQIFPGEDPVGRDLVIPPGGRTPWIKAGTIRIVGVVSNVKDVGMNEVDFNNIYLPFAQTPEASIQVVLDAALPTESVVTAVRTATARVDAGLSVISASTVAHLVDEAMAGDRFNAFLIGSFAAIALLLSAIGIYGAMAYAIEQRTLEFGVRLALGATRRTILISALAESARFGVIGTILGLGLALVLARVLGSALYLVPRQHDGLLYGVSTTDPIALASACVALITVAALSGLVPARRATRIDPLVALRCE